MFVHVVKWKPNYTCSIVTFTAQHEQHFINKVDEILNETGFAERFERLGHTDLLRLYHYGVSDAPTSVSVAIFNAVDGILKCIIDSSKAVYSFCVLFVFLDFTRAVF